MICPRTILDPVDRGPGCLLRFKTGVAKGLAIVPGKRWLRQHAQARPKWTRRPGGDFDQAAIGLLGWGYLIPRLPHAPIMFFLRRSVLQRKFGDQLLQERISWRRPLTSPEVAWPSTSRFLAFDQDPRDALRGSPRRGDTTSSPQPYTACVSCRISEAPVVRLRKTVTTMSQKSSVMQLPQFIPQALTSDSLTYYSFAPFLDDYLSFLESVEYLPVEKLIPEGH